MNEQRRNQRISRKQEDRTAQRYNGSRNAGSGSGWVRKNDVRAEHLLLECKFTGNKASYTVKAKELRDLTREAILTDRIPVMQFDLAGRNYVILNEHDFEAFLNGDE